MKLSVLAAKIEEALHNHGDHDLRLVNSYGEEYDSSELYFFETKITCPKYTSSGDKHYRIV